MKLISTTSNRRRRASRDGILRTRVQVKVLGLTVWTYLRPSRSQVSA